MRSPTVLFVVVGAVIGLACSPAHDVAEISLESPSEEADQSKFFLPAYEMEWEKKIPGKADAYDDYRAAHPQWYAATEWPTGNFSYRHMVEWEPMQEILILYSDGIEGASGVAQTLSEIVSESVLKANTPARVIYKSNASKNDLINRLIANGMTFGQINDNVTWNAYDNDTIWLIDFGPVPLVHDNGMIAFADFDYYHQRLYDDAIPTKLGYDLDVDTFRMPYGIEGGTFQGDGEGTCYTGQRALGMPPMPVSEIEDYFAKYLGCWNQTIILQDISDDGTGHIDMFFKLVNKNLALVGDYGTYVNDWSNDMNMDNNAALLEATVVTGGGTIDVERMQFPEKDGGTPRTFLNATFVNGVNLWPTYTDQPVAAAEAMEVWNDVMPGYNHIPIVSDQIAAWSGTVHCVSRTIPDGTYAPWIPKGSCSGGSCSAFSLGYSGSCLSPAMDAIPCAGPEWLDAQTIFDCGDVTYQGCCDGLVLQYCDGGILKMINCPSSCGWSATDAFYDCNQTGADPSGINPIACSPVCVPDCTGIQCGSDGCGALCGVCGAGEVCTAGVCESESGCGDVSFAGCCEGLQLQYCEDGNPQTIDCEESCGWYPTEGYYDCNQTGADPSGTYPLTCPGVCVPDCAGIECGPDGCGTLCGVCGAGEACTVAGVCESESDCGDMTFEGCCDGLQLQYCADGSLETINCPSSCGWSATDTFYDCEQTGADPSGTYPITCPGICIPACTGMFCGADGCGGTCGICGAGEVCAAGICEPEPECGDVTFEGCCEGLQLQYCEAGELHTIDCLGECGWDVSNQYYDCASSGADPSGVFPIACSGEGCEGVFGDVNATDDADVVDSQCLILVVLAAAVETPMPGCLEGGEGVADLNCDTKLNVTDVILSIEAALSIPLDATLDTDANGCPDTCE